MGPIISLIQHHKLAIEEEEEKPRCGSPQPIPAPSVAGEGRQEPPLLRVADNPTETSGAGEGYQTHGETGESEGRGKSSRWGGRRLGGGEDCVL